MKRKLFRFIIGFVALFGGIETVLFLTDHLYLNKAVIYNFSNIDDYKIFENREVEASSEAEQWEITNELINDSRFDSLVKQLESIESIAFIVIRQDTIVFENYWDGFSEHAVSNSFSMAKSYVGALIGIALKKGQIKSLEDPVANYVPHFKQDRLDQIRIIDVLKMSSGTDWNESYSNPLSITTRAYYGDDLGGVLQRIGFQEKPGQAFKYLSGDTQVLGFVLEGATGKNLSQLLHDEIWEPTGSVYDALWSLDRAGGREKAYCCINSNARDFARLGQLYLNNGSWKGKQLIDSTYIKASVAGNAYTDGANSNYGYQWWVLPKYEDKVFYARGIHGQYIIVIPSINTVTVRLGKKRMEKSDGIHPDEVYLIVDQLLEVFK